MKPVQLVDHARTVLAERGLELAWLEQTVRTPDWVEPDPLDPAAERRFRVIAACGDRIMRVVCVETDTEIRVITVFLDRKARRPT